PRTSSTWPLTESGIPGSPGARNEAVCGALFLYNGPSSFHGVGFLANFSRSSQAAINSEGNAAERIVSEPRARHFCNISRRPRRREFIRSPPFVQNFTPSGRESICRCRSDRCGPSALSHGLQLMFSSTHLEAL